MKNDNLQQTVNNAPVKIDSEGRKIYVLSDPHLASGLQRTAATLER